MGFLISHLETELEIQGENTDDLEDSVHSLVETVRRLQSLIESKILGEHGLAEQHKQNSTLVCSLQQQILALDYDREV